MKITNKNLIQSYILTTAKYDFNTYEKRILFRLVELVQYQLEGKKLDKNFTIEQGSFGDYKVTLPISSFLKDEKDNNYELVKDALRSLRFKTVEIEDERRWELFGIIETPAIERYESFVEFKVNPKIYDVILNFAKGYRKFELVTAMQFKSTYSMRFYELLGGKTSAITYNIDDLKYILNVENKYNKINDFTKRVIDYAKRELDNCSPYTFDYKTNKGGRKITSITFYPKFQPQFEDAELKKKSLQQRTSPSWELDRSIILFLKERYFFETKEISANIELFKTATTLLNLIEFLSHMEQKCSKKVNPKGYLINALKKELASKKSKDEREELDIKKETEHKHNQNKKHNDKILALISKAKTQDEREKLFILMK